jgi:hypothetical protein
MANLAFDDIDPWTKQSICVLVQPSLVGDPIRGWTNSRQAQPRRTQTTTMAMAPSYVVDYLLFGMVQWMELVLDKYAPHAVESLVAVTGEDNEDDAKAKRFVQSLDSHYEKVGQYRAKVNWYKGQMINPDIDGSIHNEWTMREENPGAWSEL